jgi:histidyl-tRNA synthetase
MEIKKDFIYKGTRILFDNKAKKKRELLNKYSEYLIEKGFKEIFIPIIQFKETFKNKVGDNKNLMFNFKDRGDRDICLAPEYTAVCQKLANTQFKYAKDIFLFYIGECFRGEKPQKGRYRQFTQLGVEILNPSKDYSNFIKQLAENLIKLYTEDTINKFFIYKVNTNVTRGLDYYEEGKGFEIEIEELGTQKQVCGGGKYDNGIGFAIGIDRLLEI